jgi:hypothetical protein
MAGEPQKKRGLQGVHKAREMRVAGKFARPTEKMWGGALLALIAVLGAYRYFSNRSLSDAKDELLGKRKAIDVTVGAEWAPLHAKLEQITMDEGAVFKGDFVDPAAKTLSFRNTPGLYLRLKVEDAKDGASIRRASQDSLKDAFTTCLLRTSNDALARGDIDAGVFPEQPWNLRQAYASTRILTDDWKHEVEESSDTLRLRVFQQQYDKAVAEEIPLAIDIIKKAHIFVLVLDEEESSAPRNDAGMITSETLQLVEHDARVVVYDLKRDALLVRLKRTASGTYMPAGDRPITDDETRDAVQRQVNNCSLAQAVLYGISPPVTPTPVASGDAGVDSGKK